MAKQNRYIGDTACGVLPLIKDSGMTSHDAVFAPCGGCIRPRASVIPEHLTRWRAEC